MQQRGRKSSEALSVVAVNGKHAHIAPPDYLTKDEKTIFVEMVNSVPSDHFDTSDRYLLAMYAQATVLARDSARGAAGDFKKVVQMEKATRMVATLSTKLRLSPQSRMTISDVSRRFRGQERRGRLTADHDDED